LGLYTNSANPIPEVDAWLAPTGRRTVIAGLFVKMDDVVSNVPPSLNAAWDNGYVPFVNLMTGSSTAAIASGDRDASIRSLAHHFAVWAGTGQRRAFIAPLPEMNGYWWAYSGPPEPFKQAFRRMRQIFEAELKNRGASLSAISWVFAPNGWSQPGKEFENYYPGGDVVDIVSINGYNFGGCPGPKAVWDTFDAALKPYLDRLPAMAPGKPIFIAETGTVEVPANGQGDKNQWLRELFTKVAAYPRFRGVVYLNVVGLPEGLVNCPNGADYRLHVPGTTLWSGFRNAMAALPNYIYWAPNSREMANIVFGRQPAQIFADVPTIHPFALEAGEVDFAPWIHALYAADVTKGCGTNPLRYCPRDGVTRAQMAGFLLKGKHGANYTPPPATGMFGDVPTSGSDPLVPVAPWIEALANEGITAGCGGGNYCPHQQVTRAQMAVFLLRAKYPGSTPPAATGMFGDVPTSGSDPLVPFAPWIEQLARKGIPSGCGGRNYCPTQVVTREQMAVFLVPAFNIPR
jgi:hypothetical protein